MYEKALLLGVLLSMLFYEWTGLSAAGIIVPAYFALGMHSPLRLVYTLLISILSVGLVKLLERFTVLYGRRRFAVCLLLAYGLHSLISLMPGLPFSLDLLGCLIPGIIARDMDRQGILKTLFSLTVVTLLLVLLLSLFGYKVLPI